MKEKMKKWFKDDFHKIIIVTIFVVISFIWNGCFGNPISKMVADKIFENYVGKNFENCYISDTYFDFARGGYVAIVCIDGTDSTVARLETGLTGLFIREIDKLNPDIIKK